MKKIYAFVMACALLFTLSGCKAANLLGNIFSSGKQEAEYDNPIDKWRNEWVSEYTAQRDAINGLLGAADSGDRSAFADMFAPVVKNNEKFSAQLDSFFEAYPVGFSECELDRRSGGGGGSYNYGEVVRTSSDVYNCWLGDEWYHITVHYCYENTTAPDEVGVDFFCIENMEASAVDRKYSDDDFIVCSIIDESKVTARMIGGYPFVFEPTPERSITLEQMREYLEKYDDLWHLTQEIGKPNVTKKYENSTGYDHYYELTSSDGSPLYAHIVTGTQSGSIYRGYICNDEKTFYDEFLMVDRTKN